MPNGPRFGDGRRVGVAGAESPVKDKTENNVETDGRPCGKLAQAQWTTKSTVRFLLMKRRR